MVPGYGGMGIVAEQQMGREAGRVPSSLEGCFARRKESGGEGEIRPGIHSSGEYFSLSHGASDAVLTNSEKKPVVDL